MEVFERRNKSAIEADLKEKMVLVSGPRQCGKTTLAKVLLQESKIKGIYYNWDDEKHRSILKKKELDGGSHLWVLDEIHKYKLWKNWLKGLYDLNHEGHSILVTGSARLDIFSKGGDSLQGRYFLHRMHPLTFSEVLKLKIPESINNFFSYHQTDMLLPVGAKDVLSQLMILGGFPEPFASGSQQKANRWRLGYGSRLVQQDIRTIENLKDLDRMEMLFERLPSLVGSILSINSLREDLEVSFPTVKHWIQILENFYACFRIAPYGSIRIKAVKKEQKVYLWDWASVEAEGPRFENLIAMHLLRFTHWMADQFGEKVELRYFRDFLGREVDFLLLKKGKPWVAVECKVEDRPTDTNLIHFLNKVTVPLAFQVSLKGQKNYLSDPVNNCRVHHLPATTFLSLLP